MTRCLSTASAAWLLPMMFSCVQQSQDPDPDTADLTRPPAAPQIYWELSPDALGGTVTALTVSGPYVFAATDAGLLVSPDSGIHWRTSGLKEPILALASRNDELFVGTYSGLLRSTDHGAHWRPKSLGGVAVSAIALSDRSVVVGTYDRGIFRSIDQGSTWSAMNEGLPRRDIRALSLGAGTLFAGTGHLGVFTSTNDGSSWLPAEAPFSSFSQLVAGRSSLLACTFSGGVFVMPNDGTTWQPARTGPITPFFTSIIVRDTIAWAGAEDGLWYSADGGRRWHPSHKGIARTIVRSLMTVDGTLLAITDHGVFRSTDLGARWSESDAPLYSSFNSLQIGGTNVYMATVRGLWATSDQGASWRRVSPSEDYIAQLSVRDSCIIIAVPDGHLLSRDHGVHWTKLNQPGPSAFAHKVVLVDGGLIASTRTGIWTSTNDGASWMTSSAPFTSFERLTDEGDRLVARTTHGSFVSHDRGKTWSAIVDTSAANRTAGGRDRFRRSEISSLSSSLVRSGIAGRFEFASTPTGGLVRSSDGGSTWTLLTMGQPSVTAMAIVGDRMVITTSQGLVYTGRIATP